MPSFCAVESCKLVKQIGDGISFHKFPFSNPEIFRQWADFVGKSECGNKKLKKISKYSSICSQHFLPSDFSQAQNRRFLKKNAVPSVNQRSSRTIRNESLQDDEPVEVEVEDPLGPSDSCSLCRNSGSLMKLKSVDEYYFSLVRKCLPFLIIDLNFLHKLCEDCIKHLSTFSSFIDKVVSSQNLISNTSQPAEQSHEVLNIKNYIKVEPVANYEDEEKQTSSSITSPQWPTIRQNLYSLPFTPPKKCEILEIVDIKPFHFDRSLQHETFDEDDIQILSPKQLKVEIDPDDEDGSNELEQIRNFLFISSIFLQDHNYVKSNVKREFDEESNENLAETSEHLKVCVLCSKSFTTIKRYLMHKIHFHRTIKSEKCQDHKRLRMKQSKRQNYQKIRKVCTNIIKTRKKRVEQAKASSLKLRKDRQQVHKQKKAYKCPTCSKRFPGPKNLYQHKISHATSYYSCNICEKRFQRPHGLRQHVKSIHEQEKKHICPICSHRFALKADMHKCKHSKLKRLK